MKALAVFFLSVLCASAEVRTLTLRDALDPSACAATRRQTGSSSGAAMDTMLAEIDETLTEHTAWSDGAREQEADAEAALLDRARELACGPG